MHPTWMAYTLLFLAIISEVTASSLLVKSEGFRQWLPSILAIVLFSFSLFLLSQVIKTIPLGIAYAIWAGIGIVLTALIGFFIFKNYLDIPAIIGIALIICGVLVINLFSKSAGH